MKPFARTLPVLLALGLPAAAQSGPAAGPVPAAPLGATESAALEAAGGVGLEGLRAASFAPPGGLDEAERASLRDLQRRHADLDQLRAGELTLSDDDIKLILITAGIVILIALIL